ncbi:MAG TPA: SRPBCC domain-containing protein, partial [Steroidobacteraceae bacterium]|nr:SRPBCC domain-containing protein [Steroidobacteraceae bacterium]
EKLALWMRPGDTNRSSITTDPHVGGEFEILMETPKGDIPHTGAYQMIDRPKRLAFTWNSPEAGRRNSLVTIDFNPAGRGTEVVLNHENLPSQEEADAHRKGWARVLDIMSKAYARNG